VGHPRHHGEVVGALFELAAGKGQRAHRAAMKPANETDELRAPGIVAGQLEGSFHRFRAGVAEIDPGLLLKWSNLIQLLRQPDAHRLVEIRAGHVQVAGRLFLDGFDHAGMGMAGR